MGGVRPILGKEGKPKQKSEDNINRSVEYMKELKDRNGAENDRSHGG